MMNVGRGPIRVTALRNPQDLPWSDVDIVLECTGFFRSPEQAALHLANGAKRVLISAPAKGDLKTIVYGINDDIITVTDRILSNASCTTNCLVPVAHVLHESFGILRGHMTTVHAYTGNQPVHDRAAETLGVVVPHLDGLITGTSIRVPAPNVSCIDLVIETQKHATADDINAVMQAAADGPLSGVLGITSRKLVSIDFNHDAHSAIFASDQTSVQQGNLMRVLAWYDNEWAFSNRMLDTAGAMARHL
jgi:glyceraldehyde 3-phosphate dehydrogenase